MINTKYSCIDPQYKKIKKEYKKGIQKGRSVRKQVFKTINGG